MKVRISPLWRSTGLFTRSQWVRAWSQASRTSSVKRVDRVTAAFSTDSQTKVHPALSADYKIGGKIEKSGSRGQDEYNRLRASVLSSKDNDPLPPRTRKRIPIKFEGTTQATRVGIPNFWLRDNCRCSSCVNQDTLQRAFDTFSIPEDIEPSEVTTEADGLHVTWANDGHKSIYPWDWLSRHHSNSKYSAESSLPLPVKRWNDDIDVKANPPSVSYEEIMADDKGVGKWTSKILEYGFCFVDGCPVSPEKTEKLLERIAFIRPTHYGGFYDFTSDLTMKDTAYTSLALPAHTDTTYFTDPAGLQMFHMLSHTDGSGGLSLLVDGYEAARTLMKEDLAAWKILASVPITWHASGNEGITITPSRQFPVIHGVWEDGEPSKTPAKIRWNNDDRGVVQISRGTHKSNAESWYWAARKWDEILKRKEMEYWVKLEPGRPLIFDNWRVLHGRSAFTGKRRMCGGYINHDDYVSRWRNTNFTRGEVLAQIL